jgi:ketosteroid isomerase-like protein
MSEENVEAVRDLWRAWSSGGIEAVAEIVPADTVAYAFPGWVGKSKQIGPDGLRAMQAEWHEAFAEYDMDLAEVRESGDRVVALIIQRGVTKEAGVAISAQIGAVYSDFRDGGQVGEVRFYPSWEEALEAGGLGE